MKRIRGHADRHLRYGPPTTSGRITRRKDWMSGEEVEYQYDSLQRLSSVANTGSDGWGRSLGYDGIEDCLRSEGVIK